jgi:signal transduction histidine kinase
VNQVLAEMKEGYEPIEIKIPGRSTQYIFYDDSATIQQLKLFPYLQLSLIGVFLVVAYVLFSTFRRSEQNLVWVGMAKETAHQLGTPLSALMAWRDLFEDQGVSKPLIEEFNKDIERLSTITERFSKIGSEAALTPIGAKDLVEEILDYLRVRISSEVNIEVKSEGNPKVNVNVALFSWVIENLVKNSVDAMDAKGQLTVSIHEANGKVYIDIKDSGKGIPKRKWKTIFEPGYTTKLRGWGLGLSLAKRIVKNYHKGGIYVLSSVQGEGTVFRIALKR